MAKRKGFFPQWRGMFGSMVVLVGLTVFGLYLVRSSTDDSEGVGLMQRIASAFGIERQAFGLGDEPAAIAYDTPAGESWWGKVRNISANGFSGGAGEDAESATAALSGGRLKAFRANQDRLNAFTGPAQVHDADSFSMSGKNWRLAGIDGLELNQQCQHPTRGAWNCGQAAAAALRDHLANNPLWCHDIGEDTRGRSLGKCIREDERDIATWLVVEGWALPYGREGRINYSTAMAQARNGKRGAWSGRFVKPWEHRGETH